MSECEHEKGLGYEGECVPCLKAELAEMREAVSFYMDEAWHHEDCPSYDGNTYTQCACGYSALQENGE